MHINNHSWLEDLKKKYPESFINAKVLDLGSYDVNGSCREHFEGGEYVGVDLMEGKGVDIALPITETKFEKNYFDTVVSFNCFEHDFNWKESVAHNLQWLRPGGMFFATFGAEGNPEHNYPVHRVVPHEEFVEYCKEQGLTVIDSFHELEKYPPPSMAGMYNVVAQKNL